MNLLLNELNKKYKMEKRTEITKKPERGLGHLVKNPGEDVKIPNTKKKK